MSENKAEKSYIAKISYINLQLLLVRENSTLAEVRKKSGLSGALFTKIKKNETVTLSVILSIAEVVSSIIGRNVKIEEICSIEYDE